MTGKIFELPIEVVPADIDELGHVNNTVYLRWAQEVAVAHWRAFASLEDQQQWLWMVTRHEIDYLTSAVPGDKLIARTWVGEARGARFDRHVEILRPADNAVLARAKTTWAILDAQTRRLARIPKMLVVHFQVGA